MPATLAPPPAAPAAAPKNNIAASPIAAPSPQTPAPQPASGFNPKGSMDKALASLGDPPKRRNIAPNKSSEPPKQPEPEPVAPVTPDIEPDKEITDTPATEPDQPVEPKDDIAAIKPEAEPAKAPDAPKKPWDLVNRYKGDNAKLKTRVAELEKQVNDFQTRKTEDLTPKLEAAQKRAQELEDEIKFVNYSKSSEFTEKYKKPFEEGFTKAVGELRGLQVQFEQNGEMQTRPIDENDIATLAGLPPDKARVTIKAMFPEDHLEVAAHVKEVRRLSEAHNKALEDARKNGTERTQQFQQQMRSIQEHAVKTWEKITAENQSKFEFLKTVEGDDEHNTALTKASEMVTQGLSKNAYDPRLSPEDRENVIRQQASIRDRAIAYSTLKLANKRLNAKISELQKSLADYQKTEPGAGDRANKPNGEQSGNGGFDGAMQRLTRYVT